MQLAELDRFFKEFLPMEEMEQTDSSLNGLQVGKSRVQIRKTAFAVDACMESFKRAADWGADLLFVHHGLFWGSVLPVTGMHYQRIRFLMENDLALYAVHLPLDAHPVYGNNAGIVNLLGLQNIEPFGSYKGQKIGFKGTFTSPEEIDSVLAKLGLLRKDCLGILPFGPAKIVSAGVISGGATREVDQALEEGLDLYVTGEISHQVYHQCLEGKINMIAGGHYQTEIWGVKKLAEKVQEETDLETQFIDIPTGL